MTFHFCGYFPKKAAPRPEGYDLPGVVHIASVSDCIAEGPEGWIESGSFNELGFFDGVDIAESIVPAPEREQYDVYAYAFLDQRFAGGVAEPWLVPALACKPPGDDFEPLGFDVVSKSVTDFFEHSPSPATLQHRPSAQMRTVCSTRWAMQSRPLRCFRRVAGSRGHTTSPGCCGDVVLDSASPR